MLSFALSGLVLLEVMVVLTAIYLYMRSREESITVSGAYAIIAVLALFSGLVQFFLLTGIIRFFPVADVLMVLISVRLLIRHGKRLSADLESISRFMNRQAGIMMVLLPVLSYLAVQVITLPPLNWDSLVYGLPRVILMKDQNTLFLQSWNSVRQASFPPGFDVLAFLFLRTGGDYCLGLFSFLSYLAVFFSCYSVVRLFSGREKGSETALRASVIVISLPQLVLQATNTKNDLAPAACAAVLVMSACYFYRERNPIHMAMFRLSLIAGIAFKSYFLAFALPFSILYCLMIARMSIWKEIRINMKKSLVSPFLYIALLLFIFTALFCIHNQGSFGSCFGDREYISEFRNHDRLAGAVGNAVRYVLQGLLLPSISGSSIADSLYRMFPDSIRNAGLWPGNSSVTLASSRITPNSILSWFGIVGPFIVLPAVFFSLVRGNFMQKITAVSAFLFAGGICYTMAWTPWHGRFFTLFFSCSGICLIPLLSGKKRMLIRLLTGFSLFVLCYTALLNESKPLVNMHEMIFRASGGKYGFPYPGPYLLTWTNNVFNRDLKYITLFGENSLSRYERAIPAGSSLLIIGSEEACIFPFLLKNRFVVKSVGTLHRVIINGHEYDPGIPEDLNKVIASFDYILVLGEDPDLLFSGKELIYRASPPVDIPQARMSLYR